MGLKLHNARRSYELRDLFLRLQNNRSLLAREVHFLSSAVYDGDIHGDILFLEIFLSVVCPTYILHDLDFTFCLSFEIVTQFFEFTCVASA